jgi:nitrous-oxide reductase
MRKDKRIVALMIIVVAALFIGYQIGRRTTTGVGPTVVAGLPEEAIEFVKERQLTPEDITAAVATYVPTGKYDDYLLFSSGGHSGQVLVTGIPSMRLLRVISVFTPEPWQGYGYGVKETALASLSYDGYKFSLADTHHPALSETNGEYDGQFLFIGDKSTARVVVIDLRDFETKQIVKNPLGWSDHGAAFATPNTEYIIQTSQYSVPLGGHYAPTEGGSRGRHTLLRPRT